MIKSRQEQQSHPGTTSVYSLTPVCLHEWIERENECMISKYLADVQYKTTRALLLSIAIFSLLNIKDSSSL